jgi:acetylglutamate kinase
LAKCRAKNDVVFVHGGGPQIEAELKARAIENRFVGGRRVTSPEAMAVVEQMLSGQINKGIAAELSVKKVPAVGLSGRDAKLIVAKPIPDLGRAAKPATTNVSLLRALLKEKFLPVISTVGSDSSGEAVNINADDAASAIAVALKAARLIFLTNISGVLDGDGQRIPLLPIGNLDGLIERGVIKGGMIPKVQSARAAIRKGVGEIDIVNGLKGIVIESGTRIVK